MSNLTIYTNYSFALNITKILFNNTIPEGMLGCDSESTLLNIANLEYLYEIGLGFDKQGIYDISNLNLLSNITNRFKLPSNDYAFLLWNYVKYVESELATNSSFNGSSSLAGMGVLGGQAIYQSFQQISETLLLDLTATLIYSNISSNFIDCPLFISYSIPSLSPYQIHQVCSLPNISSFDSSAIGFLIQLCWYPYGEEWLIFVNSTNITDATLFSFCSNSSAPYSFSTLFNNVSKYIHDFYNCTGQSICSRYEIAAKQWGNSTITLDPIPPLNYIFPKSYSLYNWFPNTLPKPVEYLGVLSQFSGYNSSNLIGLDYNVSMNLMSFNSLWSSLMVQKAFLLIKNNLTEEFTDIFPINLTNLENYMRYMAIEVGLNGFSQTRSVTELLWGYTDPVLYQVTQTSPLTGGDPSTNPFVAFGGQNSSYEDAKNWPTSMYTGEGNISNIRNYQSAFGEDTIVFYDPYFNGTAVVPNYSTPWLDYLPLTGTDAVIDEPNMNSSQNITIFISNIYFVASGYNTDEEQDYFGVEGRRYRISNYTLANKTINTYNEHYYSDRWNGVINMTVFQRSPIFLTKAHFLDVDWTLYDAVDMYADVNLTQKIVPNPAYDDIYIDIEPISGLTLGVMLQLQSSYQLDQDDLFTTSKYAMLPMFYIQRSSNFTEQMVNLN